MSTASRRVGVLVGCVVLLGTLGAMAQDWPQWRGPNRDNKVNGFTEPKEWPKSLTKKWQVKVGLGDAWPVLAGDKVFVFARAGADEILRAVNAADGKELWAEKYAAQKANEPRAEHPGPRCTPVVGEGKVCALGVRGTLICVDADTGKLAWRKDTKDYPVFFTSASPLIHNGMCIAVVGGRSGQIVGFDLKTGAEKLKWSGEGASYGSPILTTLAGTKQIVTLTNSSLVGISLDDGKLLWKTAYKSRYNSETPVALDGDTVLCSGAGTQAFKVKKDGDTFSVEQAWKKSTASHMYNTPVLKDGLLYGLTSGNKIYCLDAKTGDTLWTDDTARGQCGAIFDAGSVLIALSTDMNLLVFKPSREKYTEVAKYKVADSPTWAAPILAGKRIFVKDRDSLILWTIE